MRKILLVVLASVLCCLAHPVAAQTPDVIHFRQHYALRDAKGTTLYVITSMRALSETVDETHFLIDDADYGLFLFDHFRSYAEHTSSYVITEPKRKAFVKASFPLSSAANTKSGLLAEQKAHPSLNQMPTILTLETNGGIWQNLESDFDEGVELRKLRTAIRQTVDAKLLEGIERMRGSVFATTDGSPYHDIVARYVLHSPGEDKHADSRIGNLTRADLPPDCDFDKSFGYPCSDTQIARIKKATEEHRKMDRY